MLGVEKAEYNRHYPDKWACGRMLDELDIKAGLFNSQGDLVYNGEEILRKAETQDKASDSKVVDPMFELDSAWPAECLANLMHGKNENESEGSPLRRSATILTPKGKGKGRKATGTAATAPTSKPSGVHKGKTPTKAKAVKTKKKDSTPTPRTRESRRLRGKVAEERGLSN